MDRSEVSPLDDVSPAGWLLEQLVGFEGRVRDVVPTRYDAVARVLHQGYEGRAESALWSEIAAYCGTTLHPLAQYWMLSGNHPRSTAVRPWPESTAPTPVEGSLDRVTLPALRDLLLPHTTTPDRCWLALWEGYGGQPPTWRDAPTFRPPHRGYHLFAGALADLVEISVEFDCAGFEHDQQGGMSATFLSEGATREPPDRKEVADAFRAAGHLQSPNLWWPEDRAWCVASEIDFDSTLVAGSAALIAEVVGHPDLEALEVAPSDSLTYAADAVNMR